MNIHFVNWRALAAAALLLHASACNRNPSTTSGADLGEPVADMLLAPADESTSPPDLLPDPCMGVVCAMPPAASCTSATSLRTYAAGTCANGTCSYAPIDYPCPNGCQSAACQPGPAAWPMVGFDATHAGRCPYHGPKSNVARWTRAIGGAIASSPVIGSDGTVYVGAHDGKLHAVNRDGSERWTFATGGAIDTSPAVAVDGTIYVSSQDGKLYAVDATGKQKWSFQTGAPIEGSSPVFDASGTIYVASNDKNLYAVSSTGAKKWAFTGGEASSLTASLGPDGTIYWYAGVASNLLAVSAQGTQKWSFTCDGGWFDDSPVVNGFGHVYTIHESSLAAGVFKEVNPDGTAASTIIEGANLQVALDPLANIVWASNNWDSPGWSLRLSSPTGVETWRTAITGTPTAPPTVDADGTIYLSIDGGLSAYKGANGSALWTFSAASGAVTSAAIGPDGVAFVGDASGVLYAIGP